MKILITGYPGWLSSRFIETLGDYPCCFDEIRCLVHPAVAGDAYAKSGLEIIRGDLLNPDSLDDATKGMDLVLHAAGIIHVRHISQFYRINRDGTENLLKASVRQRVKRFIYISSNAAQGFCPNSQQPLTELDPCKPASPYGKSKWEAEEKVRACQQRGELETVILRPAMFYGPPVPKRHLNIFKRILAGTFPVFGSGEYPRSITYIDHLIQGIHLALVTPAANGQTYSIADEEIPTLNEILRSIGDALGRPVKIVHLPEFLARGAEMADHVLSSLGIYWMLPHIVGESCKNVACEINKAKRELGYRPTVNYAEGYKRTIAWCRDRGLIS